MHDESWQAARTQAVRPQGHAVNEVEIETTALRAHWRRHPRRFLKGPIPLQDLAVASQLPGAALAVLLLVHHRVTLTGQPVVTLPRQLLHEFGVEKDAKLRALRQLERAGLIGTELALGRAVSVWLRHQALVREVQGS